MNNLDGRQEVEAQRKSDGVSWQVRWEDDARAPQPVKHQTFYAGGCLWRCDPPDVGLVSPGPLASFRASEPSPLPR